MKKLRPPGRKTKPMGIGINTLPAPAIKHLQTHYNRRLEYGRGGRVVQLQPGDWHRKMAAICLLVLVDNNVFSASFRIFPTRQLTVARLLL